MLAVPLQCPTCAGLVQIDPSLAGQAVACPHCQAAMVVPPEQMLLDMLAAAGAAPAPPPFDVSPTELLTLGCPVCTGPFQVPAAMAGQQVGCPHCGAPITIPGAEATMPPGFESFGVPAAEQSAAVQPAEPLVPPSFDDLLPPGAAAPRSFSREPKREPKPIADDRLPKSRSPARDDRLPPAVKPASQPASPRPRELDDLLPPGAAASAAPAPPAPATQAPATKVRPAPSLDDLLPPGAGGSTNAPVPSNRASIDSLLPPGAAGASAAPFAAPTEASAIDSLLPPGATGEATYAAGDEVPLPAAPKRSPIRHLNAPAGAIVVPTPDGGFVSVRETPKTVGEGDDALELKRLSADERAKRRLRNNLIFGAFCLLILFVVLFIMLR